jgi:hypothetical protein
MRLASVSDCSGQRMLKRPGILNAARRQLSKSPIFDLHLFAENRRQSLSGLTNLAARFAIAGRRAANPNQECKTQIITQAHDVESPTNKLARACL